MPTSQRSTAAREKNMQPCNNCRQHKYGCEFIDERTCGRCKSKGIPCVRILKSKRSRTQSTVVTANVSSGASSNVGPPPTEVDLALGSSLEHPQSFPLPIASGVLPYVGITNQFPANAQNMLYPHFPVVPPTTYIPMQYPIEQMATIQPEVPQVDMEFGALVEFWRLHVLQVGCSVPFQTDGGYPSSDP